MSATTQQSGDLGASAVAAYLRDHKQSLSCAWERAVLAEQKQLAALDRAALIDHLPEVLDALAAWVEGDCADADTFFSALADGHAIQRLGFGIGLTTLSMEYRLLRRVILTQLLTVPSSPEVRRALIRLDDGLDHAIFHAVHRYAQSRDALRDRFIGVLGHDLRNPLASALFAVEVLRSHATAGPAHNPLETLGRALDRMSRMIGDVLDFARGHLGDGIPARPIAADMAEVCRSAVAEARSAHPHRTIDLSVTGDLVGTFDRDRVLQALVNLLTNAVQHGEDPIVVTAMEAEDRRAVLTRVTNGGKPIARETLNKLFDPFTSGSPGRGSSLGLGLYIVAEIARAHGGTCEVSSSEGETAFTIRWPRTPRTETPERP